MAASGPPDGTNGPDLEGGRSDPVPRQDPQAIRDTWWPPVSDMASARKTARYGFWAAVVNIAVSVAVSAVLAMSRSSIQAVEMQQLIEAAVFMPVAVGLYFYSRAAAVAALLVFAAFRAAGWLVLGVEVDTTAIVISVVYVYFFIHGIRGAFALHAHSGTKPDGGLSRR